MIDKSNIWMVIKNNDDLEYAKKIIGNPEDYKSIQINYKRLKQLLKFDYIQIGDYKGEYEDILGAIQIDNYFLSVEGFNPKIILKNQYFKSFFKYLIKWLKLKMLSIFTFYYSENKHIVALEIEGIKGVIARAYWSGQNV